MDEKTLKYDAFISYRHSELDKFVATTLHKKLEAFKLPKGVKSPTGKKKIERVFRDQDELPLASNLSDPITMALENSDFLLVICTPRLPQSEWCKKEIETFIKLHGRDRVLAVLAEGEPDESFPEALTREAYEVTNPDGTTETKYRIFEPLAADVRGKNNKAIKKAMNDAVLRICAAMFGLNYDEIKQRHKERAMRRTLSVVSAVAAALMLFSAVCLGLMFKIINQSEMIMDQNTEITQQYHEIQAQSEQIKEQNKQIEEQYTEAKLSLAHSTTLNAQSLIYSGRKFDAVYALRKVMPSSSKDNSYPYSADAEFALCDTLELYADSGTYIGGRIFESESTITATKLSPEYTRIATLDVCKNLHVWDTSNGNELLSVSVNKNYFDDDEHSFTFLNEDTIIVNEEEQIKIIDYKNNTEALLPNPSGKSSYKGEIYRFGYAQKYAIFANQGVAVYNFDSTDCISYHSYEELGYTSSFISPFIYNVIGSEDGKEIIFTYAASSFSDISIITLDLETDSLSSYEIPMDFSYSLISSGENIYISGVKYKEDFSDKDEFLLCANNKTGTINWKTETPGVLYEIKISSYKDIIYGSGYDYIYTINIDDGNILSALNTYGKICNIYPTSKNAVRLFTTDCGMYMTSQSLDSLFSYNIFYYKPNISVEKILPVDNYLYVMFDGTNYVSLYEKKPYDDNPLISCPYSSFMLTNSLGQFLRRDGSAHTLSLYSLDSKEPLLSVEQTYDKCTFVGDGTKYFADFGSGMKVYNISDGSVAAEIELYACPLLGKYSVSNDREYIMSDRSTDNKYYLYSLTTGEVIYISEPDIPKEEKITVYNLDKDNYAIKRESGLLEIYKRNAKDPYYTTKRVLSDLDDFQVCQGTNIFTIVYTDGTMEFYRFGESVELFKTNQIPDLSYVQIDGFYYYSDSDFYTLSLSDKTYVFNNELDATAFIPSDVIYIPSQDFYIYYYDDAIYSLPHYSYDDLIIQSNMLLNDYTPPENIIQKYGIVK